MEDLLAEAAELEKKLRNIDCHYYYGRRFCLAALMIERLRREVELLRGERVSSAYCTECGVLISNDWVGPKPPIHPCYICKAEEAAKHRHPDDVGAYG